MVTWRFIETEPCAGARNMAIDEALLLSCARGDSPPTFRIYSYKPGAISVGYFQSPGKEANLAECEHEGLDIIRRLTGGGAVLKEHPGGTTYGITAPSSDPMVPRNIIGSYRLFCGGLVRTLEILGLEAEFAPINDVLVNGRKVSGNAQTRRHGGVLQHGTLLIDVDAARMFRLLTVSQEKYRDRFISSFEERVTSVKRELGRLPGFDEVNAAMRQGFMEALGVEFESGELTPTELKEAERLERERYATREWNFRR